MNRTSARIALALILLVGLWLRLPHIGAGLPFFYQEDEAHHFHRLVEMVQRSSFNPKYFQKPTLHFYMRMPVLAVSFVSAVQHSEIRNVREIATRPTIRGTRWHALSASHPRLVIWNRAFTVCLSVFCILLAYLLARELIGARSLALAAAWLTAVSPPLIADSAKIGVDTPMVFMCLLAIYLAVRLHQHFSLERLAVAGLIAGLAFSTKYNAAPVLALPIAACLLTGHTSAKPIALAVLAPIAGFVAGTPFLLVEMPAFLNQMAFQVHHYGVRGHGRFTGTPGMPQVLFYLDWFARQALGYVPLAAAVAGLAVLASQRNLRACTFLLFPVAFFALMVSQRVNFTRNMLTLVPILSVLAVVAMAAFMRTRAARRSPRLVLPVLLIATAAQPTLAAFAHRSRIASLAPDTRVAAMRWLSANAPKGETAVSSDLQMPASFTRRPNIREVDAARIVPEQLFLDGYDRLLAGPGFEPTPAQRRHLHREKVFPGTQRKVRVPRSPQVTVYRISMLSPSETLGRAGTAVETMHPPVRRPAGAVARAGGAKTCYRARRRDAGHVANGCWITSRFSRMAVDTTSVAGPAALSMELSSPWPRQSCTLERGAWRSHDLCASLEPDRWQTVSVELPAHALSEEGPFVWIVERVHTVPARRRAPAYRAGVALRNLELKF